MMIKVVKNREREEYREILPVGLACSCPVVVLAVRGVRRGSCRGRPSSSQVVVVAWQQSSSSPMVWMSNFLVVFLLLLPL